MRSWHFLLLSALLLAVPRIIFFNPSFTHAPNHKSFFPRHIFAFDKGTLLVSSSEVNNTAPSMMRSLKGRQAEVHLGHMAGKTAGTPLVFETGLPRRNFEGHALKNRWSHVQRLIARLSDFDLNMDALICSGIEVLQMPHNFSNIFPEFARLRSEPRDGRICKRFMQIECMLYMMENKKLSNLSATYGREGPLQSNEVTAYKFEGIPDFERKVAYPFVSSEGIEAVATLTYHLHSQVSQWDSQDVIAGDIIVVRGVGASDQFWSSIGPKITVPYILISQTEAEDVLPGRHGSHVNDTNLWRWYLQNLDRTGGHTSSKLRAIPIGFTWRAAHIKSFLLDAHERALAPLSRQRENLVIMQFTPRGTSRTQAYNAMSKVVGVLTPPYYTGPNSTQHVLNSYSNAKFVVSPFGAGPDCHRTWEALSVGAVPIVESHSGLNELFADMPILIVKSWNDVTNDTLMQFRLNSSQDMYFKIFVQYWWDTIVFDAEKALRM